MLSRRSMIQQSFMLFAAAVSVFAYGCNVYDDLENWITVGIASLNSIVVILKANGITPASAIVNAILGALNATRNAIVEYKSTTPPPVGAVAKIETALKDVVDNFTAFLRSLSLGDVGLFSLISGLLQIIFSTIAGFQNKLPVLTLSPQNKLSTSMAIAAQVSGVPVVAQHRTVRQFKKDWNTQLDNGPSHDVNVPRSAYHHISVWEHL
jgi:hypothetical protein